MILDTNYLIRLFEGDRDAHEKSRELHSAREIQRIPAPVLSELEYGAELHLDDEERRRIRNLSRMYSITRLDEFMARRAGQLYAQADRNEGGNSGADMVDAMVASVADTTDEAVLTDNVTDFKQLGVRVETY